MHYKVGDERAVLNPGGDEHSLASVSLVRPPLNFRLYITLLGTGADGTETAVENYTVDFRQ